MYLLYLDDSGSAPNANEEYFVLGGVSVFESQVHWITTELDKLAQELFPALPPSTVEFHASDIFSGREAPWDQIRSKLQRIGVIHRVLDVFCRSYESAKAFAVAIHKPSYRNHDLVKLAFEDLCSRFDLHLIRANTGRSSPDRGLLIVDKSSYESSLQKLAVEFRSTGTRWRRLQYIVDVPLFVDSNASRLVQLADHVAYSVFRRYNAGDTSYLDKFMQRFDASEGEIHGLVHKQTFNQNCMCPACMSRR